MRMLTENADLTKSLHVDESEYRFTQWDADKSFRVLAELGACVGEALHLRDAALAEGGQQKLQLIVTILRSALTGIGADPERSLRLVKRLTTDGVLCNGERLNERVFLTHFQGKLPLMMEVAGAALEAHFGAFFSWLNACLPAGPLVSNTDPSPTKT